MRRFFGAILTGAAMLLVLACGGGESPEPTETATPAPSATPTAAPTVTGTATPEPTPTSTPSPTPEPTPFPTPTGPAVTVEGPLVVLSEGVLFESREDRICRVYVADVDTGRFWTPLDYSCALSEVPFGYDHILLPDYAIELAGTNLVVWSDSEVRLVGLNGHTEALLFEHEAIRELMVSPDGRRVAITHGDRFALTVIDIASGEGVLEVVDGDPRLAPLLETASSLADERLEGLLTLGNWSPDSSALSVRAFDGRPSDELGLPDQVAILTVDGDARVLPRDWLLFPDFRHVLRPGEQIRPFALGPFLGGGYLWKSFDVTEADASQSLWTVEGVEGQGIVPADPAMSAIGPGQFLFFEAGDVLPADIYESVFEAAGRAQRAWEEGLPDTGLTARLLDLEGGESRELSHVEWVELKARDAPVCSACYYDGTRYFRWPGCFLLFDGQVVWEGYPELIGLIEFGEPLQLQGLVLREWVEPRAPPDTSRPAEVVGPLLVYSLLDAESRTGEEPPVPLLNHRVVVHDTGTGHTWTAFEQRVPLGHRVVVHDTAAANSLGPRVPLTPPRTLRLWPAGRGLVVLDDAGLRYVALDGTGSRVLIDELSEIERLSQLVATPGRERIAVLVYRDDTPKDYLHGGEGHWPASYRLLLFDLPSGNILASETLGYPGGQLHVSPWREEYGGFVITVDAYDVAPDLGILDPWEAVFRLLPEGAPLVGHLSPGLRYAVRVWLENRGRYWDVSDYGMDDESSGRLEVIDYQTERVLWSVDVASARAHSLWTWVAPDRLAWASGEIPDLYEAGATVSVLTVSTGEVEVMDSAEFTKRPLNTPEKPEPEPEPRASVRCPDDRGQPCQVLLDGEVVGEGRWAEIIGFIELD